VRKTEAFRIFLEELRHSWETKRVQFASFR
jgi:hypothetical protein